MSPVNATRGLVLAPWDNETFVERNDLRDEWPALADAIDALADGNGTVSDVVKAYLPYAANDQRTKLLGSWPALSMALRNLAAEHSPMASTKSSEHPIEDARLAGVIKLSKVLDEVIDGLQTAADVSTLVEDRDYWRKLAGERRGAMVKAAREAEDGKPDEAARTLNESLRSINGRI